MRLALIQWAVLGWFLNSALALAGAFDEIEVTGPCTKKNMEVIENGDVLSILLHDFGANMPQGEEGDGKSVRRQCGFTMRITFPKDQYLAGLTQVFSGGVIKSKRASGQIQIMSKLLAERSINTPLEWKRGQEITPESEESIFNITLEEGLDKPQRCSGRLNYKTRLTLQAQRPTIENDFFIGAIDSIDTELTQRVDLIPEWQPCSGPLRPKPRIPKRQRAKPRGGAHRHSR